MVIGAPPGIRERSVLQLLVALTVLSTALPGAAATSSGQVLEYDVSTGDKHLGTIVVRVTTESSDSTGPITRTTIDTRLRAKVVFITVFSLEDHTVFREDGTGLLDYRSDGELDGDSYAVREGERISLTVTDDEGDFRRAYTNDEFDMTSLVEPVDRFEEIGQTLRFRVLDLDHLEIVERSFTWAAEDTLTVGDHDIECVVLDVEDEFGRARRWVARSQDATTIREDGVDEDGPYSLILHSIRESSR